MQENILIIGIGNQFRNDDAAGLLVINQLRKNLDNKVIIEENNGDGIKLIEQWKNKEKVIIIDAVNSGSEPGTIHEINIFDNSTQAALTILPEEFKFSTHLIDLTKAIKLAESLGYLPLELSIFGIEGKNFNSGTIVSEEVKTAIEKLVLQINNIISQHNKYMEVLNG
jgi:hydrogenase maturation protease